jgi:hypothetical protein
MRFKVFSIVLVCIFACISCKPVRSQSTGYSTHKGIASVRARTGALDSTKTLRLNHTGLFFLLSHFTADGYCLYRLRHPDANGNMIITLELGKLDGFVIRQVGVVLDRTDDGGVDAIMSSGDNLYIFGSNRIDHFYDIYQFNKTSQKMTRLRKTHYLSEVNLKEATAYSEVISGRILAWGEKLYRVKYDSKAKQLVFEDVAGTNSYFYGLPGDPVRLSSLDSGSVILQIQSPEAKCILIEAPSDANEFPEMEEVTLVVSSE